MGPGLRYSFCHLRTSTLSKDCLATDKVKFEVQNSKLVIKNGAHDAVDVFVEITAGRFPGVYR